MNAQILSLGVIAALGLAVPANALQAEELVAHWNFNETMGTTLEDQSSNSLDATIGPGVLLGQQGGFPETLRCASFDGNVPGTTQVPDQAPLTPLVDNLSVAAWVRPKPGGPFAIRRIFGASGAGWSCGLLANGLRFTTKGIQDFDLPFTYVESAWMHVVFVFDAAWDVTYYVDGVNLGTRAGNSPANAPSAPWVIGAFSQTIEYWHGDMDDVQVYRGSLTQAEVSSLFSNPGSTIAPAAGLSHCLGDGSGAICPCGNLGGNGEGCGNSTGQGALLEATGSVSVSADDLRLDCNKMAPGGMSVLFSGGLTLNGGNGLVFGDGLRCAGSQIRRLGIRLVDGSAAANWSSNLSAVGQWSAGDTRVFQVWYQDAAGPCSSGFNTSQAISLSFSQ